MRQWQKNVQKRLKLSLFVHTVSQHSTNTLCANNANFTQYIFVVIKTVTKY